ncbi:hypothetical protein [Rhodococcoides yunnanense]|nr:hypothetical protein [Rhodococcus yunnanensis]
MKRKVQRPPDPRYGHAAGIGAVCIGAVWIGIDRVLRPLLRAV